MYYAHLKSRQVASQSELEKNFKTNFETNSGKVKAWLTYKSETTEAELIKVRVLLIHRSNLNLAH